jgi:hypothetical protein
MECGRRDVAALPHWEAGELAKRIQIGIIREPLPRTGVVHDRRAEVHERIVVLPRKTSEARDLVMQLAMLGVVGQAGCRDGGRPGGVARSERLQCGVPMLERGNGQRRARSPSDHEYVCVALAQLPSGARRAGRRRTCRSDRERTRAWHPWTSL